MIRIEIAITGTIGFILAIETSGQEPGSGYDWDATGTAAVVGQARITGDGSKAWLWPQAGTWPGTGRHVQAVDAELASDLIAKLRKQHQAKGAWWQ